MPEVNLGKVVGPKGSDGAQGPAGADGLSAYEQAQAGGYSGSELEFNQQLAGLSDGPFVPESDKGVASGVATLDSTGKVPSGQLPSMDYIPTSQKGAASGVASLDATGKLEETQKPDYTASEVGAVPTTRTVNGKSLSSDVVLTGEDIKTSASDNTHIGDVVSVLGGATTPQGALANLGAGVRPNLLINPRFQVNQRGQSAYTANGYTVDMWTRLVGGLTVTPIENGVRLTWTAGIYFRQGFENPSQYNGKTVTISGMFSNPQSITGCSLRLRVNGSFSGFSVPVTGAGCFFATFQMPDEVTELWLEVGAESGSIDWNYAKLEEGDTQTLAYQDEDGAWQLLPQPESDYATQLAKCQRYFRSFNAWTKFEADYIDANRVSFSIPGDMRIEPTVTGDWGVYTGFTLQNGFVLEGHRTGSNLVVVASKESHGLTTAWLGVKDNSFGYLNADL